MLVERRQKWISVETDRAWFYDGESILMDPRATGRDEATQGHELAKLMRAVMPNDGQEHLAVVCADAHGVPLAVGRVASGSVDNCPLYARDVYAFALAVPRTRFVAIAHNHPSGVVTPSGPDKTGSSLVARIGKMLSLDLLWSMVVTHESDKWALVPLKYKADDTGEREPSAPKDPEPDEDEQGPEPEDEGEPESDGTPNDEPEDGDGDEDEPEPDGESVPTETPEQTPDEDGDEDGEDGSGDEDEDGDGSEDGDEDGEAPEGDSDPEGGQGEGDSDPEPGERHEPDAPKPGATVDELRAALRAAFKL